MNFRIDHQDTGSKARAGVLQTPHGEVHTPVFMPVGTRGAVKTLTPRVVLELGTEILLGNTYHLLTRPGPDIIAAAGGLHRFMAWDGPILTDSGGFQVYSLAGLRNITDEGALFNSHIDGQKLFIGPHESMEIQQKLGSDIAMVFDECPPSTADKAVIEQAVTRSIRWAGICYERNREFNSKGLRQLLFGIVQGGTLDSERQRCIEELLKLPFAGYAIGGLAVGEENEEMYRITELCCNALPEDKPRYLMGVGTPEDIVQAVMRGVDMFDCVLPTRNARNGSAFTDTGTKQIKSGRYKDDFTPVQEGCECYACRTFSKAYIRHLLNVNESLGGQLLTIHNVYYYLGLTREMREAIRQDRLQEFAREFFNKRSCTAVA